MKTIAIAAAAIALCASLNAVAQTTQNAPITRAEVRQQLIDAEAAGWLPINNVDYPPSAQTMKQNAADYSRAEAFDARHPHLPTTYTAQAPDAPVTTAQN